MGAEVNVLLKYNRSQPSWSCPLCETENSVAVPRCALCGCVRDARARILKAGVIQDDLSAPPLRPMPTPTPGYAPTTIPTAKKSGVSGGTVAAWLIFAVVAIVIFVLIVQNS